MARKLKMVLNAFRFDVHHHIVPPDYISALNSVGITKAAGVPFPMWKVERDLKFMDKTGIAVAITSISSPGIHFGDRDFSRKLARVCNEFSANLVRNNPRRFGSFAVLPLPDVDASLVELKYALDDLKLDGVTLLTSIDGQYLGDPAYNDLYRELNRRKTVVFVHPNTPNTEKLPSLRMPPAMLEFVFDTTRAIANLIYSGTSKQFPDIRFIFSHAGGTAPFLTERISFGNQDIVNSLKKFYYDVAISSNPYALKSLQELVPSSHIVFGSDYPFLPEKLIAANIEGLANYKGFDNETRESIERVNASDLFPRFKS